MPKISKEEKTSTKVGRALRANRHILPIKIKVRQKDGSYIIQIISADVREDKRNNKVKKK
jgi:hypothetical protein